MLIYQTERLYTEIGAFMPPTLPEEFFRIVKSPAAGVTQAEDLVELMGSFLDYNEISSGPYKDMYPLQRSLIKTIPFAKTIKGMFHPSEKVKYFK